MSCILGLTSNRIDCFLESNPVPEKLQGAVRIASQFYGASALRRAKRDDERYPVERRLKSSSLSRPEPIVTPDLSRFIIGDKAFIS